MKYILRSSRLRVASIASGLLACAVASTFLACSSPADDSTATGGAGVGTGGTGGGGTPSIGGGSSGGAPACDIHNVLMKNCSAATCHGTATAGPNEMGSGLDLFTAGVEGRVYNQPADYKNVKNPEACPTPSEVLIDPAGLDTSLMWKKITKTHACGDDMPQLVTFDENETACYKTWLESIIANPPAP